MKPENKEIINDKNKDNKKVLQQINNASSIDDIKKILKIIVKGEE